MKKLEDRNIKILLTISETMKDSLKQLADEKELPLSTFIRMALKEYVDSKEKKSK